MEHKQFTDEHYIKEALLEAEKAFCKKEAPIGAVAVHQGKIVARAHNLREKKQDPLGHAELILLRKLSHKFKNWRILGITLYVTLEPCLMCMGALLQARIQKIVYGTPDPKAGACGSLYDLSQDPRLNHQIEVKSGVLQPECSAILKKFFENLRKQGK
jgi:tRNA(adenine34) deaminase